MISITVQREMGFMVGIYFLVFFNLNMRKLSSFSQYKECGESQLIQRTNLYIYLQRCGAWVGPNISTITIILTLFNI